jgi:hypothetical protein
VKAWRERGGAALPDIASWCTDAAASLPLRRQPSPAIAAERGDCVPLSLATIAARLRRERGVCLVRLSRTEFLKSGRGSPCCLYRRARAASMLEIVIGIPDALAADACAPRVVFQFLGAPIWICRNVRGLRRANRKKPSAPFGSRLALQPRKG